MFKKILIANRGEIAVRIIRACKELNIKTVAVYSEADRCSLHVRMADESYCIGPANAAQSYLNIPNIISCALISGAQAIHPGYGFLAENEKFVEICESHGIKFIGPSVENMVVMGDKVSAREKMKESGIPVIPGTECIKNEETALQFVKEYGFPIMIKAAAGGGGKGIRLVNDKDELIKGMVIASAEAQAGFGDERIYLEKSIIEPRHIEMQILADSYGNIVHLGERDCSVQRRKQKLIEESPSVMLNEEVRKKIGEAAITGASAINYIGAGTMEFLYEPSSGRFYFMEMNTRIQVEHPVSEMVTGIDLIKEQLRIASGEMLGFTQKSVVLKGHAIECRINAEEAGKSFSPSTGTIMNLVVPGGFGVRVDTHIYNGLQIPPFYDSLLAKVIAYGNNRNEAISRMERALSEFYIEGLSTTIPFLRKIINSSFFREGDIHTTFVEQNILELNNT